ncbi:hypothetical protein EDB86DRAFT_3239822 [Lactarius hatsudake]|nr:hypothetical protein EDB86DRAFT_3239822 [Lactarius hatsudake]
MAQVLSHNSVTFSNVVHLKLAVLDNYPEQLEGTGDIAWPYLFHQFSNVQTLHVSRVLAGHVAAALEDITGEMAAEVFPSLDLIYLAGHPTSTIRNFIAARQLSDRPITVVNTKTEFNERLKSYTWVMNFVRGAWLAISDGTAQPGSIPECSASGGGADRIRVAFGVSFTCTLVSLLAARRLEVESEPAHRRAINSNRFEYARKEDDERIRGVKYGY